MRFEKIERHCSYMYPNGRGLVVFGGEVYCRESLPDGCDFELVEKDGSEILVLKLPDGGVIEFLPRCMSMKLQSEVVVADLPTYTQYYFPTMRMTLHIYSCFKG